MLFKRLIFTWFVVVYFLSSLAINCLQLCVFPLYYIHKKLYYKIISILCYCLYCQITFLGEWWSEIDLKVYGKPEDIKLMAEENWVTVANHFSDIDWLIAWVFCERVGILGDTMCFMKDSSKYIPTVGWAYWFAGWGFLKRDWKKDEQTMLKTMDTLRTHKHHYCMMLYCEGTRRTDEKLQASQDYAKKNNQPILKHHLLPRTKGFIVTMQGLKEHAPALYDVEMAFSDVKKATISSLISKTKLEVHLSIRRIPMSDVCCSTAEEATEYCMKLYQEKEKGTSQDVDVKNQDKMMEYFLQEGRFDAEQHIIPRGYLNLIVFTCYNLLVACFFLTLGYHALQIYGINVILASLVLLVIGGYGLLAVLNRVTQTKKGSNFGLKSKQKAN